MDYEKVKDTLTHTAVTVGAPLAGSGIGFLGIAEAILPAVSLIGALVGIVLGIWGFILKRRIYNKQLKGELKDSAD